MTKDGAGGSRSCYVGRRGPGQVLRESIESWPVLRQEEQGFASEAKRERILESFLRYLETSNPIWQETEAKLHGQSHSNMQQTLNTPILTDLFKQ